MPVTWKTRHSIAYRFGQSAMTKRGSIATDEIRVLVSTDVLSEGQNLSGCPYVLITICHGRLWINTTGRPCRRIGQKSNKIYCYSFLPEDGVDDIINLRGRLQHRIRENLWDDWFGWGLLTVTVNIRDLYNEKAGILDDERTTSWSGIICLSNLEECHR